MRKLSLKRPQMTGSDVKYAQRCLAKHNMYWGKPNGVFDERTAAAVAMFKYWHHLPQDHFVDDATWSALTCKPTTYPDVSSNRRAICWLASSLLDVPYIWGSTDPTLGLDPLGFLLHVMLRMEMITEIPNVSLMEFLSNFQEAESPQTGDLVWYTNQDGSYATHVLIILNETSAVGPIGGDATVTTRKVATVRQAKVKIVPYNYRRRAGFLKMRSFTSVDVEQ